MGTKIEMRVRDAEITILHAEGFASRHIADKLGLALHIIQQRLKVLGLNSNPYHHQIIIKDDGSVDCSKCGKNLRLVDLPMQVRKKHSYRLSYCRDCRTNQTKAVLAGGFDSWAAQKFSNVKSSAKRRGIPFTITKEEIYRLFEKQSGKCFYTGVEMTLHVQRGWSPAALSWDRVRSVEGYVSGNVVLCTARANAIKRDMTLEEMREWMPHWYARVVQFMEEGDGRFYRATV
jgi:hypothetical protein